MLPILNASLVLYNTNREQLTRVIACFFATTLPVKLYLVDNSPTDELKDIAAQDSRIEYIYNNANLGYGAAHNIAIRKSIEENVPYHLVLNPDIYFEPGVLETLYDYMEKHPDVGNVMPKVLYPNGEIQYLCKLLPTPMDLIVRRFIPFRKIKEKMNERYELRWTGYDKEMNIPYLSGCFMFLRVESLKKVGLFDERFFMYPEDIDLTRRLHEKFKTIYYPKVIIIHDHAKESYINGKMLFIHIKNIVKYFNKWGWFFDTKRRKINHTVINTLRRN
jgi:GT2 family glycosyltransferase